MPTACFIAIAITGTILIFPQSLNSIVLDSFNETNLKPIQGLLKLQDDVLATVPSDHKKWAELAEKGYALRSAHAKGVNALQGQIGMLQLEMSRGQIGPGDLTKIFNKAKELGTKGYGLASFLVSRNVRKHD